MKGMPLSWAQNLCKESLVSPLGRENCVRYQTEIHSPRHREQSSSSLLFSPLSCATTITECPDALYHYLPCFHRVLVYAVSF